MHVGKRRQMDSAQLYSSPRLQ